MSLKKILTGKPGNLDELIDEAKTRGLSKIHVTYKARNRDTQSGLISIEAYIIFEVGGRKVQKSWDERYGPVVEGQKKRSMIDSLRNQTKPDLTKIENSGLHYEVHIDIPNSFV